MYIDTYISPVFKATGEVGDSFNGDCKLYETDYDSFELTPENLNLVGEYYGIPLDSRFYEKFKKHETHYFRTSLKNALKIPGISNYHFDDVDEYDEDYQISSYEILFQIRSDEALECRKEEWLRKQIALQQEIIKHANVNIISCSSCSCIILYKCNEDVCYCPDCDEEMSPHDNPDLFF